MKMLKLLFIVLVSSSVLSCGNKDSTEVILEVAGKNAYLIDAPGQSCQNIRDVDLDPVNFAVTYDVGAMYFSYSAATISWTNTENTAYIQAMKVEFASANVTYECTVSGEELLSVFYDKATNTAWDGSLLKAKAARIPTQITSFCPIRCGGVTVPKNSPSFTATGKITLVGFQRTPAGEEFPLKTTASVRLYYQ